MTDRPFDALTDAQARVVRELARGYDPPEIAARLGVSVATVRFHIRMVAIRIDGPERPIRRIRRWALERAA